MTSRISVTARATLIGTSLLLAVTPALAQIRPSTLPSVRPSPPAIAVPLPAPIRPSPQPIKPLPAPFPPIWYDPTPMPPPGWDQSARQGNYFAGTTRCESQNFRTKTCRARTQNRVEVVQIHGGTCQRGRSFRYDFNGITVSDGCRATFAYGYGNVRPKVDSGNSALPWMLAGAGATAGMVALANSGNNNPPPPQARPAPPPPPAPEAAPPPPPPQPQPPVAGPPFPMLPPARIEANIQMLTPDQQRTMQICLFEGARQTGLAGGTVMALTGVDQIVQGNGGWRFTARGTATFPDKNRNFSVFCRGTPTSVIEFTVTPRM